MENQVMGSLGRAVKVAGRCEEHRNGKDSVISPELGTALNVVIGRVQRRGTAGAQTLEWFWAEELW